MKLRPENFSIIKNGRMARMIVPVTLCAKDIRGIQVPPNELEIHFRNQQGKDHVIRAYRIKRVPYYHSADNFEQRRHHV